MICDVIKCMIFDHEITADHLQDAVVNLVNLPLNSRILSVEIMEHPTWDYVGGQSFSANVGISGNETLFGYYTVGAGSNQGAPTLDITSVTSLNMKLTSNSSGISGEKLVVIIKYIQE